MDLKDKLFRLVFAELSRIFDQLRLFSNFYLWILLSYITFICKSWQFCIFVIRNVLHAVLHICILKCSCTPAQIK